MIAHTLLNWVGWIATFVMVASYCIKGAIKLRLVQMCSALLWLWFGALLHSFPMIVANGLVFLVAAASIYPIYLNARLAEWDRRGRKLEPLGVGPLEPELFCTYPKPCTCPFYVTDHLAECPRFDTHHRRAV